MRILNLCELNDKLQWRDFHDANLLSMSFQFLDNVNFSYSANITLKILTSFKDNPEKPIVICCLFKQVKNIELNANMDDKNFSDSCTIYSLHEKNDKIELKTVKGWRLVFHFNEIDITAKEIN